MSKFCMHCGKEVNENAVVCIHCGCAISNAKMGFNAQAVQFTSGNMEKKSQASTILGILGIVFAWIFALVGHIVSIIGIVLGTKEYKETGRMTGLLLSIIGEICSIISSIIGVLTFSSIFY